MTQDRRKNNTFLMALAIVVMAVYSIGLYQRSYDNDIWFILASGEYIVEHGFPQTNPFTIVPDMGIVIQQWLPDVIAWGIYQAAGFVGLGLSLIVCVAALMALLYRLGRVIRQNRSGGEIMLWVLVIALPCLAAYLSVRPHVYTMIAFTWVLILLERYRQTGRRVFLCLLPALVCVHVNFHAAMAPFDCAMIACYLIPDFLARAHRKGKLSGIAFDAARYPRLPLLICLLACVAVLFINPYGWKGAAYLLLSLEAPSYGNYISEMGHLDVWCDYGFSAVICFALGMIAMGRLGARHVNLPFTILFVVCSYLGFAAIRNVWLIAFFAYPLIVYATRHASFSFERLASLIGRIFEQYQTMMAAIVLVGTGVVVAVGFVSVTDKVAEPYTDGKSTPVVAVEFLDSLDVDKEQARLFNFFNAGGFLEFHGYKVFIDARPELFNEPITGIDRQYYYDFVDFAKGNTSPESVVEEFDFDYMVVDTKTAMSTYLEGSDEYEILISGHGYDLWGKSRASID